MEEFLQKLKSQNAEEIKKFIANSEDLKFEMLEKAMIMTKSADIKEMIKSEFINRFGVDDGEDKRDCSNDCARKEKAGNVLDQIENKISKTQDKNIKTPDKDEFTEKQALDKYAFHNSKHDKALEMFFASFKSNIKNTNFDKVGRISKEIVKFIISKHSDIFPKEVRSKSHNLKENSKLCSNLYFDLLGVEEFVAMTPEQMQSEEVRSKDSEYLKNSLLDSQMAKTGADTDMFTCGRCKQKKCTYTQLQTRSCDEPMTTFVTCTVCGLVWKF
jgi:transcription elongation factor S-II